MEILETIGIPLWFIKPIDRQYFFNKEKVSLPWKTWVICGFIFGSRKNYFVFICYLNFFKPNDKPNG